MNTSRYSRQELFPPIGAAGQAKLKDARVLVVGAGALGTSSAEMLVRAGVGHVTMVDRDYVEWSNLQRQQLYTETDVKNKLPKAIAAQNRLMEVNSEVEITGIVLDVNGTNVEELVQNHHLILDAADNFETRLIVNDAAVQYGIPFVFGACVASYGMTFPMIPGKTPCLHCLINHLPSQNQTCDTVGVISPIVQLVTAYQVTSALKILTGNEITPSLQSFDIWKNEQAEINVSALKNKDCPTCGSNPTYPFLAYENQTKAAVLCGRNTVQIRPGLEREISLQQLAQRLKELGSEVVLNPYLVSCTFEDFRLVFFKDGRALIHGTSDTGQARAIYNRIIG
ncbi:thiazole biosynthesis adenylyltransferase ThiF [Neobacillus mesonae]|uniref:thiazole biosynthesis adenylyltransferase ThiF n=1 Tax=Neobacillus mesonae TaxID=1193713 RepID=UPI0020415425|nr:thiazole biosynthesis adenylyltransferase ThiF [Neobacillus mesonae]MCM3571105.1 thiazole biosynthesis adenylyltransferase ThiF [Neobacillus mesonae]